MKYCQKGAMVNVFVGYAAKVVLGNRLQFFNNVVL
jgi:hypothetical protein